MALEAMASGCLCVVADTGGLREVVPGDGTVGLRFPSRDTAALGAILERVLTDVERAQLVAEAREHVLRFDWARWPAGRRGSTASWREPIASGWRARPGDGALGQIPVPLETGDRYVGRRGC